MPVRNKGIRMLLLRHNYQAMYRTSFADTIQYSAARTINVPS